MLSSSLSLSPLRAAGVEPPPGPHSFYFTIVHDSTANSAVLLQAVDPEYLADLTLLAKTTTRTIDEQSSWPRTRPRQRATSAACAKAPDACS